MPHCPHCDQQIVLRELPHPSWLANYRVCPYCEGYFTVDKDTKIRQAYCLVIALISLALTLLLYFKSDDWLVPSVISYIALGLIIYWGNKQLFLVPYQKKGSDNVI